MAQNLKNMLKSTFCSYLQIIKTVCPIKFEIFRNLILDLVFSQFMVMGPGNTGPNPWYS